MVGRDGRSSSVAGLGRAANHLVPLCLCLAYGMRGGGVHRCGSGQPLVEMRCDDFDLLPVEATMWAAARLGTGEEP